MPTQSDVDRAEQRILAISGKRAWSPKALRKKALDGFAFEVISLAFWRLLDRGELRLDKNRQVRRAHGRA